MTTNPLHEKLIEEMFDTEYMTGKQPNLTKEFARTTFLQIEQATREEFHGRYGYVVVDPETENYTYSHVFLNKNDASQYLKAMGQDGKGLKVIEVEVHFPKAITKLTT